MDSARPGRRRTPDDRSLRYPASRPPSLAASSLHVPAAVERSLRRRDRTRCCRIRDLRSGPQIRPIRRRRRRRPPDSQWLDRPTAGSLDEVAIDRMRQVVRVGASWRRVPLDAVVTEQVCHPAGDFRIDVARVVRHESPGPPVHRIPGHDADLNVEVSLVVALGIDIQKLRRRGKIPQADNDVLDRARTLLAVSSTGSVQFPRR